MGNEMKDLSQFLKYVSNHVPDQVARPMMESEKATKADVSL